MDSPSDAAQAARELAGELVGLECPTYMRRPSERPMPLDAAAYALSLAAAMLMGLSKTGVPGVALPAILLMTQAYPGNERLSVGAMLPVLLVGDVLAVAWYRRHAQWDRLLGLFPAVLAGMVPAFFLLRAADDHDFKLILGWMILGLLAFEALRKRYGDGRTRGGFWFTTVMGLLAGFGTALGNAAGPVMTIFLVGRGLNKQQFMGTWAWFFLIVNALKLPAYWQLDLLTAETLHVGLLMAPATIAGALVGRRVFSLIPQGLFDILILTFAGLAALRLVFA
jgi:uncharacterized membrane protein YfcA